MIIRWNVFDYRLFDLELTCMRTHVRAHTHTQHIYMHVHMKITPKVMQKQVWYFHQRKEVVEIALVAVTISLFKDTSLHNPHRNLYICAIIEPNFQVLIALLVTSSYIYFNSITKLLTLKIVLHWTEQVEYVRCLGTKSHLNFFRSLMQRGFKILSYTLREYSCQHQIPDVSSRVQTPSARTSDFYFYTRVPNRLSIHPMSHH